MANQGDKIWVCMVCGYIHRGPEPPEECPVCGCPPSDFEETVQETAPTVSESPTGKAPLRIIIAGGGIAGVSAAESVRQYAPEAEITLISREAAWPYYRINLTRFLAGELDGENLSIHPESWYAEQRITVRRATSITAIHPEARTVTLENGEEPPYDKLILACGAEPFIPPIPGHTLAGVAALRTIDDAQRLLAALPAGSSCVCIGGGILGLEIAGGLARRNIRVTVLESAPWLLSRQLDERAAGLLARHVAALGIAIRTGVQIAAIEGAASAEAVRLADGEILPADVVMIAAGVRPATALAQAAGLTVNRGVVVNDALESSHPDIYAVGDLAEHRSVLYGLWEPARYQGSIAGMNAAGTPAAFGGMPPASTLKVLGLNLFSVGKVTREGDGVTELVEMRDNQYFRFLFEEDRLVGAILLGDTQAANTLAKAIKNQTIFPKEAQESMAAFERYWV